MNNDNRIGLMSVADLKGFRFVIPEYQRGYRWEKQQVTDLLKDLKTFMDGGNSGYYCLQPLAVKSFLPDLKGLRSKVDKAFSEDEKLVIEKMTEAISDSVSWEVIDGQQRLTTMYILIRLLDSSEEEPYFITYTTRTDSAAFLKDISQKSDADAGVNIDFFYMRNAFSAASKWIDENARNDKANLLDVIKNRVKFIWYESVGERPIDVFTRLNIGKISLTNAELIKATLLNRSNYPEETGDSFRHLQLEIASKWDRIEYALQNDEFWLFLNSPSYVKPTRIDFLFEMIFSQDVFMLKKTMGDDAYREVVGNDRYSVFRYFAAATSYYKKEETMSKRLNSIWDAVNKLFGTFVEWFDDKLYYHYIGYLIWNAEERKDDKFRLLNELLAFWDNNDKVGFKKKVITRIKETIVVNSIEKRYGKITVDDINKLDYVDDKDIIKRILLLHNIQNVIESQEIQADKYQLDVFFKFPFHIFKKEVWNVEHIDSATTNELTTTALKKAWARAALFALESFKDSDEVKNQLNEVISLKDKDKCESFQEIFEKVEECFPNNDKLKTPVEADVDQDNERNHPWNLALLDEGTNKSYKNYIFSVKRSFIIFKEKGQHCHLDDNGKVTTDNTKAIAFVPPCTKQVFMKYYNTDPSNLLNWGRKDAEKYLADIKAKLKEFLS